jgi:hypothetical protein
LRGGSGASGSGSFCRGLAADSSSCMLSIYSACTIERRRWKYSSFLAPGPFFIGRNLASQSHYIKVQRRWATTVMMIGPSLVALSSAIAAAPNRADYIGGTVGALDAGKSGSLDLTDGHYLAFYTKSGQIRVPYNEIELLEYGQKVDRRLLLAIALSPMFLLSKQHKHFLTVGFKDEDGNHQVMLFRVDKNAIRAALVSLEARTGLKVQYQDDEARKAGKG